MAGSASVAGSAKAAPTEGLVVRTVLGDVAAGSLGSTLIHEHLLIDNPSFVEPSDPAERVRAHEPVGLANLGWLHRHWTSNADNLVLDDEAMAVRELAGFAQTGGRTIVDATVPGIGRDPLALRRIAQGAGVQIVMGSGAYVGPTHPPEIRDLDAVALADRLVEEWHQGVDGTGIRPGFFGEIGCSWPIQDRERTVVAAAGRAQRATGAALMIHPGRNRAAPSEIISILETADANLERVVIAHLDRTITDTPGLLELAATGVYLEFDCFGLETSYYPFDPQMAVLSDAQRLGLVRDLIDAGLLDRILLAHDICTKHRLSAFGGHGYGHLFGEVVPWMWQRGFSPAETTAIFVTNPARLLGVPRT